MYSAKSLAGAIKFPRPEVRAGKLRNRNISFPDHVKSLGKRYVDEGGDGGGGGSGGD